MSSNKILVVDDEETILFAVSNYFETCGIQVDYAHELEEAEAMLITGSYSVLVTDLCLTGAQGLEGLELIRFTRENCPWMRILVMTGYGSPELELEAHKRGVNLFLHKPKPLAEILQSVVSLLGDTHGNPVTL